VPLEADLRRASLHLPSLHGQVGAAKPIQLLRTVGDQLVEVSQLGRFPSPFHLLDRAGSLPLPRALAIALRFELDLPWLIDGADGDDPIGHVPNLNAEDRVLGVLVILRALEACDLVPQLRIDALVLIHLTRR
jgi:hypothetical protein